jgi:putative ABC transport system substrate-binding protein
VFAISSSKYSIRALATAALAFTIFTAPHSAAAEPAYSDWFRFGGSVEKSWHVSEVAGNPSEVRIRPRYVGPKATKRKVMVVYPRPSSAYDTAITKILDIFADKNVNADIDVVNFRKNDVRGRKVIKRINKDGYHLVFSMGSESTAWLFEHYKGGAVPVISVCSKDPVMLGQAERYDRGTGTNFAFTSLNMPVEVQMAYVLELMPQLKNFAILVDSKNVSAVETQAKPMAEFARLRGMRVLELAVQDPKQAKEELHELVRSAVATMRKNDPTLSNSVFWITGSTSVFREIATINKYADRVPVLSVVPEVVTAGNDSAVLSIGISFESNAHLAAIYGAQVLSGESRPGDMVVGIVSPPDIAVNFRKAREIGLKVPFNFLESATYIYDYDGRVVRNSRTTVRPE